MNLTYPLILASKSPRRQEILTNAGFKYEVKTIDVAEDFPGNLDPTEIAEFLAIKKSKAYTVEFNKQIILTADTTVVINKQVLNKPQDKLAAEKMLKLLSGKTHQVITGVSIVSPDKNISFSEVTDVSFDELSTQEISYYIDQYRPYDKAGAYGIQEWIGMIGIHQITGSYYNVMGLPIRKIYKVLKDEFSLEGK